MYIKLAVFDVKTYDIESYFILFLIRTCHVNSLTLENNGSSLYNKSLLSLTWNSSQKNQIDYFCEALDKVAIKKYIEIFMIH